MLFELRNKAIVESERRIWIGHVPVMVNRKGLRHDALSCQHPVTTVCNLVYDAPSFASEFDELSYQMPVFIGNSFLDCS